MRYCLKIDGLKSKSGQRINDFVYQVEFFGGKATPEPSQPEPQPEKPQQPQQEQPQQKPQQKPQMPYVTPVFGDVPATHWAKASIDRIVKLGVVQGYPDKTFRPVSSVTSAEFNTMLAKAFYRADIKNTANSAWWKPFVQVSETHNILKGTLLEAQYQTNGAYGSRLDAPLTRYDMAQMMYNLLKDHNKAQVNQDAIRTALSQMKDWDSVPASYRDALTVCYTLGLLKGEDNGAFCGENHMERAQACVVITRLIDYINA